MSFIDAHREDLGIEPICRELAIAPSSYHEHAARLADHDRRPARARRDDELREAIKRVHDASFGLYGTRKVWHQLRREGMAVAKCTVERLMRAMGLAGAGQDDGHHRQQPEGAVPARQGQPRGPRRPAERSVGGRFYLRPHLGGVRLRCLCDRCLRPADRGLEGQHQRPGGLRARCIGTGDPCPQAKCRGRADPSQ